jgi:cell division protein FtsQ
MSETRKISVRKVLQTLLTLVMTVACIMAMVSAASIADSETVKDVAIHIQNNRKYHVVEEDQIRTLAIENKYADITHTPMAKLDIHAMEQTIMADPWVEYAQVYIDNERVLHLYVTERVPVARVFQEDSRSFYLDSTMSIMPLSDKILYYTTVVTNVPPLSMDSAGLAMKKSIVTLSRKLQSDSFWNAQISHVVVDSGLSFTLIPLLGDQKIVLGDLDRLNEKLGNLFAFYKNVSNRIGWDKYEQLDLRFKGQIIASPSLPYKGPVDKAVDKMNWIASIVETEARNDSKLDSLKAANPQDEKGKKDAPKQETKAKEDNKKQHSKEAEKKDVKKVTDKKEGKNEHKEQPREKAKEQIKDKKHLTTEKDKTHKEAKSKHAETEKTKVKEHKSDSKKDAHRKAEAKKDDHKKAGAKANSKVAGNKAADDKTKDKKPVADSHKQKPDKEIDNKVKAGKEAKAKESKDSKETKGKNIKQPTPKYVYPE